MRWQPSLGTYPSTPDAALSGGARSGPDPLGQPTSLAIVGYTNESSFGSQGRSVMTTAGRVLAQITARVNDRLAA